MDFIERWTLLFVWTFSSFLYFRFFLLADPFTTRDFPNNVKSNNLVLWRLHAAVIANPMSYNALKVERCHRVVWRFGIFLSVLFLCLDQIKGSFSNGVCVRDDPIIVAVSIDVERAMVPACNPIVIFETSRPEDKSLLNWQLVLPNECPTAITKWEFQNIRKSPKALIHKTKCRNNLHRNLNGNSTQTVKLVEFFHQREIYCIVSILLTSSKLIFSRPLCFHFETQR